MATPEFAMQAFLRHPPLVPVFGTYLALSIRAMKTKGFRVAVYCCLVAVSAMAADKTTMSRQTGERPAVVAKMKTEDSAFALLIESYRQLQHHNIESDYQQRLAAAAQLDSPVRQAEVRELARKERDLRLEELKNRSGSFDALYSNSRPASADAGPSEADTEAAAKKLESFVAIRAVNTHSEEPTTEVVPASVVLRKTPAP